MEVDFPEEYADLAVRIAVYYYVSAHPKDYPPQAVAQRKFEVDERKRSLLMAYKTRGGRARIKRGRYPILPEGMEK